jgi:hypothetical protein
LSIRRRVIARVVLRVPDGRLYIRHPFNSSSIRVITTRSSRRRRFDRNSNIASRVAGAMFASVGWGGRAELGAVADGDIVVVAAGGGGSDDCDFGRHFGGGGVWWRVEVAGSVGRLISDVVDW